MLARSTTLDLVRHTLLRCAGGVCAVAVACLLTPAVVRAGSHRTFPVDGTGAVTLTPGSAVEREMEGGGEHLYSINVEAGQFLQFTVQQKGIDVVLSLSGKRSAQVTRVDRPNGTLGRESLSALIKEPGTYELRISSLDRVAAKGAYALSVTALRAPMPGDETRVLAEQAVSEGELLRARGTAESFRGAIQQFERAAELWLGLHDTYEEAWALYGAGWSYASLGENQEASRCFDRATPAMTALGDTYGEALTRTGLAWARMYMGETSAALEDFSRALQLQAAIRNVRGVAVTTHGIAWSEFLLGEPEKALASFEKALVLRREVRDRRGEALTLVGIGKVMSRLGRNGEALGRLEAALVLIRELGDRYAEADTLSHIGWVHLAGEKWAEAMGCFEKALPLRRLTGDRAGEATTLFGIARARKGLGDLPGALTEIEGALRILETLRTRGANQQLRTSYFASVRDYYQFAIELLAELDRKDPSGGHAAAALIVSERARARSLLDLLNEARVNFTRGIPPELVEKRAAAQRLLSAADERRRLLLSGRHTEAEARAKVEEVAAFARQYEEAEAQIREASPEYAALTQPDPPTAAEIQEVIGPDALLLEYFAGDHVSYLWLVDRAGVTLRVLPGRDVIDPVVRDAYQLITARNRSLPREQAGEKTRRVAEADEGYRRAASRLSTLLLAPAGPALGGRRLLFVADGPLQYVPFASLPAPDARGGPGPGGPPLILKHEVITLPSAATLVALRRLVAGRPPAPKSVLVMADPVFDASDERFRGGGRTTLASSAAGALRVPGASREEVFPRLFSTRWEADQIISLAGPGTGAKVTDFSASRSAAVSPSVSEYRIVHFATHAVIDETHPELSGVVLSLVDRRGRPQDGLLYAHDVFNLRLNADLVVLSACRTGLGKDDRAEGLMGLTRGFMYAGAPRVVASLWSVNDKSTAELMVRFYRNMLKGGLRPSPALRAAQIEMLNEKRWAQPYYWSGVVLQGEWR